MRCALIRVVLFFIHISCLAMNGGYYKPARVKRSPTKYFESSFLQNGSHIKKTKANAKNVATMD